MALLGLVAANNLSDVADREKAWDNIGSSLTTGNIGIPAPSLDLNFASNKSLVDDISGNNLITFSRASASTFVGSNGLIQTAASGVPRFDHNPATGESLGLMVEDLRTNLALYSDQLDRWSPSNAVITANYALAPDGLLAADLYTEAGVGTHAITRTVSLTSGTIYTLSCYFKDGDRRYAYLGTSNFNNFRATFDLALGTTVATSPATSSIVSAGNSWYRCSITFSANTTTTSSIVIGSNNSNNGSFGSYSSSGPTLLVWGAQLEAGSFPTSYIPTVASTVTRAADVASITGANFSGWYNQSEGTLLAGLRTNTPANVNNGLIQFTDGTANNRIEVQQVQSGAAFPVVGGLFCTSNVTTGAWQNQENGWIPNGQALDKWALGFNLSGFSFTTSYDSTPSIGTGVYPQNLTSFFIGHRGTISRLVYWPSRLNNKTLQYITQLSISSIDVYSVSFTIKGRDVLALEDARNTSTRDFIFIKGLLSAAQPRLTAAAASTASGLALASNALLKLAPTSSGDYFFASGLTLSGVTTRINGTNALSIATSPFSGSTATAPLLFRELRPQANWRITEPMPSGTIASPELAIPFETNDFVLFMKAGQN